jgi:putative sporulation protein YyaC
MGDILRDITRIMKDKFTTSDFTVHYKNLDVEKFASEIIRVLPPCNTITVMCIGSDKSTGDALGPLVGTLLQERRHSNIRVYGTLHNTLHAQNLREFLSNFDCADPVIAVDSCIGTMSDVGTIYLSNGPLAPGSGVGYMLPLVGNISISGIVCLHTTDHGPLPLFTVPLSMVMDMAKAIAESIHFAANLLAKEQLTCQS